MPNIFTAFECQDGKIWAGTQNGLCAVENGKLEYALRRLDASVPLIVTSGYNDDPVMAGYSDYGFSGVLMKPFGWRDLQKVLSQVLVQP